MVGAHPDDESIAGPLLAYACVYKRNPCHIAVFTRGSIGSCGLFLKGCSPDLATVRSKEMKKAARRYQAGLDVGDFDERIAELATSNLTSRGGRASLDIEGSPHRWLGEIIEGFRPDVILTLDENNGFTGNHEHKVVSRLVKEVINSVERASPAYDHLAVFHVLNRYTMLKPMLGNDPGRPTEKWDMHRTCGEQACVNLAMEIAWEHRSQIAVSTLGLFVLLADKFDVLYLRRLPDRDSTNR